MTETNVMPTKKILKDLYYQILRLRMVEEKIAEEYKDQEIRCPTHLYIGQEAIAAGVSMALVREDIVYSTHRSHGHYLSKGGSLKKMIAEIYGKEGGCTEGIGGSQHLIDLDVNFYGAVPIVGETIALAVGSALSIKMKKEKRISVVYLGDAATEEGIFAESLNFAVLKKLPVLFVCENNLYSVYTHISQRQPKRQIYRIARSFGANSYRGDGNDVTKVYRLAKKAVSDIKGGEGPVFIELMTYRLREHCGPNLDPDGYRLQSEYEDWLKRSPIERLKKILIKKKIMSTGEMDAMRNKIDDEIAEAFDFAKRSPFPRENPSLSRVYA